MMGDALCFDLLKLLRGFHCPKIQLHFLFLQNKIKTFGTPIHLHEIPVSYPAHHFSWKIFFWVCQSIKLNWAKNRWYSDTRKCPNEALKVQKIQDLVMREQGKMRRRETDDTLGDCGVLSSEEYWRGLTLSDHQRHLVEWHWFCCHRERVLSPN